LHKSEERLSLVLRGTQDGFWDWDLLRNERYYSPRWWNMLGYEDGELAVDSELWRRLLHPDDLERVRQVYATALTDGTDAYEVEFRLRHKRGHYLDIIARAFVLRDELGRAIRVSGANRDITRRKQMEDALREQEEFFRLIAENLEGFVAVLDVEGRRVYNSPSYTRLLGERNLSGTSSFVDIHPADRERVTRAFRDAVTTGVGQHLEFRFLRADGGILFMESRSGVIRDNTGKTKCIVVVSHDVTARNEAEGRIHHLAFYDALTQLPNRLTLKDRLSQCMAASKRNGCYGALMFLDLDNFKPVNDTHGHEVGDLLLIEAADRLRKCIREIDTVARFGGDEPAERRLAGKQQQAHVIVGTKTLNCRQITMQEIEYAAGKAAARAQFGQRKGCGRRFRTRLEDHRGARQERRNGIFQRPQQGCSVVADHRHDTAVAGRCRASGGSQDLQGGRHLGCRCCRVAAGFLNDQAGKVFGVFRQRRAEADEQGRARVAGQRRPGRQGVTCRLDRGPRCRRAAQGCPAPDLAGVRVADIEKSRRHRQIGVAVDPQRNGQDFVAFGHYIPRQERVRGFIQGAAPKAAERPAGRPLPRRPPAAAAGEQALATGRQAPAADDRRRGPPQ
jgi:diguanylate cyclase (GGDEF)-like protein/PAS domain S-box-containing protein